jgi:hypothetical protein
MNAIMRTKSTNSIATVSGVDALYYQQNVDYDDYTAFFLESSLNSLATFGNFQIISENWTKQYTHSNLLDPSDGRIIARISFKNLNTRDFLESIMIKLDTYYMNIYGILHTCELVAKELQGLGLRLGKTKVSRLDLNTYVYGHDFHYLTYYRFSTLVRTNSKFYSALKDSLATFYLGSRSNGGAPYLRIYDKWLELREQDTDQDKQAMIRLMFLKEHELNLDDRNPLWNVEFELKRELLKIYNINTIEDVFKSANMLHNDLMKRYRLLTKKRKDGDRNTDKIPTAPIWQTIERNYNFMDSNLPVERTIPVKHSKHMEWLLNRLDEYLDLKTDDLTDSDILIEISKRLKERKEEIELNKPYVVRTYEEQLMLRT